MIAIKCLSGAHFKVKKSTIIFSGGCMGVCTYKQFEKTTSRTYEMERSEKKPPKYE